MPRQGNILLTPLKENTGHLGPDYTHFEKYYIFISEMCNKGVFFPLYKFIRPFVSINHAIG